MTKYVRWRLTSYNSTVHFQATVELHGQHTRGQLVLEKRGKSLKNSKNAKSKGSNEDSVDAGMIHVILEMDVEKLKQLIINALS